MEDTSLTIENQNNTKIGDMIRVETALSRYPIHKLGNNDKSAIIIEEILPNGEKFVWRVYNRPGALAYRLDTLVVNRIIDESGRPVPEMVRLGTLNEICRKLNLGRNTKAAKAAVEQSAWAIISAKIYYKTTNGKKKHFENQFPRCKNLYFTGDEMPDGSNADAVYMVFHENYLEILNTAQTRPLDYNYLRGLTPTGQRLYELLSFQMYAANKHDLPHAKLLYSDYCKYAPQTRNFNYDEVKKQMYKIHVQHLRSKYLEKVKLEPIITAEGDKDWWMIYTPGVKARQEFQNSKSYHLQIADGETTNLPNFIQPPKDAEPKAKKSKTGLREKELVQEITPEDGDTLRLIKKLEDYGIKRTRAIVLVEDDREEVIKQLDALPFRKWADKDNFAGMLVDAVAKRYTLPSEYYQTKAEVKAAEIPLLVSKEELKTIHRYCRKCYGAMMEIVPGKGARKCQHEGITESLQQAVEDGDLDKDLLVRYQVQTNIEGSN